MKPVLTLMLVIACQVLTAQSSRSINANNIKTSLDVSGIMFQEGDQPGFFVPYNGNGSPVSLYGGALWMGGFDPDGNLKMAHQSYRPIDEPYAPGLFNEDLSFDFNKVWKLTSDEINAFIEDAADGTVDNPLNEDILTWPAAGNEGLESIGRDRLAPFVDADGDNLYNPLEGDYPVIYIDNMPIIPEEMLLSISHGNPDSRLNTPKVEIQNIVYAFSGENDETLANSLFMQQKVISRENVNLTNFRFSYFFEPDIGCFVDDYMGSLVNRNSVYAYNGDDKDGDDSACIGNGIVYDDPPVISLTMLNQKMTYATYFVNPTTGNPQNAIVDPYRVEHYYDIMGSTWLDGTPLTEGGYGYNPDSTNLAPVTHAFFGNPNIPGEWSMVDEEISNIDIRTVSTHELATFNPEQVFVMDAVINFVNCPGYLSDIDKLKVNIDELQELYNNNFDGVSSNSENLIQVDLKLYPNPNSGQFSIVSNQEFESYVIFNTLGLQVSLEQKLIDNQIDVELENGPYLLKLKTAEGDTYMHKFIIE